MKSIRSKAATAGVVAALALGGTLAATAPASAATPGAYNGACGKGYEVFRESAVMPSEKDVEATTYLAYSDKDKRWCAVTVRTKPGARVFMEVTLDHAPSTGSPAKDSGYFKSYAGPVYKDLPEPGHCMAWSATVGVHHTAERGLCP